MNDQDASWEDRLLNDIGKLGRVSNVVPIRDGDDSIRLDDLPSDASPGLGDGRPTLAGLVDALQAELDEPQEHLGGMSIRWLLS